MSLLRYPCTLAGYVRLALLAGALVFPAGVIAGLDEQLSSLGFIILAGLSRLLDPLDGYLARRYGHVSRFGALLDLMIDLLTHTAVWLVSGFPLALALLILEWTAGLAIAAFSLQPKGYWKTGLIADSPRWVAAYFANNQRNFLSIYSNVCHFLFPALWYLDVSAKWVYYGTIPGLILYEVVTLYLLIKLSNVS